jgi:tyrosyl-tRNA synthetase
MLSGVDLIRKKESAEAHVLSGPIVMNKATGKKFGKSEAGAVWLDPDKTSPFQFYQFWLNSDDESVLDYLKYFTLVDENAVNRLAEAVKNEPQKREAQKTLAYLVTSMVHSKAKADSVVRITESLFGGADLNDLEAEDVASLKHEMPHANAATDASILDILVSTGLASSKSEARRYLVDGAVSVNGEKYKADTFAAASLIHGHAILKRGKNTIAVIKIG